MLWPLVRKFRCVFQMCGSCLVPQSCPALCNPMDCSLPGPSVHGDSPGKNTGVGCHAILQGIFPTWGSTPGVYHCRWILYPLKYENHPGELNCSTSVPPTSKLLAISQIQSTESLHLPSYDFLKNWVRPERLLLKRSFLKTLFNVSSPWTWTYDPALCALRQLPLL